MRFAFGVRPRASFHTLLCAAGFLVSWVPCRATEPLARPAQASNQQVQTRDIGADLDGRRRQLSDAVGAAAAAEADRSRREADLESLRTDRLRLSAALIDTTARVRAAETQVSEVEKRLDLLTGSEDAIRTSLQARRSVVAEVLAALQRMGRKPLPAILARPDDVLLAIRTSMLLGAVVPELRSATEALAADLAELARLRASVATERDRLAAEVATLGDERTRLAALVEARQAAQSAAEGSLEGERQHAADLARQATSLKDLVTRLENDVASARRATEAARADEEARHKAAEAEADGVRAKAAAGAGKDPARLAPAVAFADARGRMAFPAAGSAIKNYGANDAYGGQEHGLSLATRPQAVVTSPADGWISFAGPYRSYGQLLIINGGDGYYIVLAGLERTSVAPGQFVVAGEPVGTMGDGSVKTAAAIALGAGQPVLYVEFRKDGLAIDPSPWWAKAELEKVRG